MMEALEVVEEGLTYYWDNLRELSKGNPNHVQKELEPVYERFKRVQ